MTDLQSVPEQWLWNPKLMNFWKFHKTHKNHPNSRKSLNSWTRGDSNSWKREEPNPASWQSSFLNWAWCLRYGIFPLASLGWLPGSAASQLLHISWIWETEKSPWFRSNNRKHQCYQNSSGTKSRTQQLLRGKLTLSQPKPGHGECFFSY